MVRANTISKKEIDKAPNALNSYNGLKGVALQLLGGVPGSTEWAAVAQETMPQLQGRLKLAGISKVSVPLTDILASKVRLVPQVRRTPHALQ